jgi:AcrR family transcriptional regulator
MSTVERRAERRELLLDAAFDLLGTAGWSATTVRAVVEHSALNPRYFYESFEDLDALIVAVYDRVVEALGVVVLAALEGSPDDPAEQVRAVVRATVEFVDEDRRRGRILYVEGLGNEALNLRRVEAGRAVVAFIERYAADRGRVRPDDEQIGRVGAAILVGGFSQLLIDWLAGRVPVGRDQLIDDATELFLALGDAASSIASRRRRPGGRRGSSPGRRRGAPRKL